MWDVWEGGRGSRGGHQEAVLGDLLRHPQIVAIRDVFFRAPDEYYLVYDFAGSDLAAVMKATSPGPLLVRSVMLQMLLGLEHIHAAGIIHCDMKPQNVLVEALSGDRWYIRIGDLGSAIEVLMFMFDIGSGPPQGLGKDCSIPN